MSQEKSKLWQELSGSFNAFSASDIASFREPGSINSRLASWDPMDTTARHFKFGFWNAVTNFGDAFLEVYAGFKNTAVGNPMSIRIKGQDINIDYALSADEVLFLRSSNIEFTSVIEIGAGFGRTCHALMSSFQIDRYTIVDLPEVLELSKTYLKYILDEPTFSKITFLNALDETLNDKLTGADLAINIDSFQEMTQPTILAYENNIIQNCTFFYSKQAIGKYDPAEFGIIKESQRDDVFEYGLSTEVFTICDDESYRKQLSKHLINYSFDGKYRLKNDRTCAFFHLYHHTLYEK